MQPCIPAKGKTREQMHDTHIHEMHLLVHRTRHEIRLPPKATRAQTSRHIGEHHGNSRCSWLQRPFTLLETAISMGCSTSLEEPPATDGAASSSSKTGMSAPPLSTPLLYSLPKLLFSYKEPIACFSPCSLPCVTDRGLILLSCFCRRCMRMTLVNPAKNAGSSIGVALGIQSCRGPGTLRCNDCTAVKLANVFQTALAK